MDAMPGFVVLGILLAIYFLPWIIAANRNHHQVGAIAIIDVFLGWTFVGWVIALAMACSAVKVSVSSGEEITH
jgi:hypothetical protein